ncbi:hypothetical protein [uncultured Planktosalinus sp.]|uniref:hypothetical protein n=1 Tax=uncultured Planktosalinus sp. TaxID=1810935 RepID=UPI0030DC4487
MNVSLFKSKFLIFLCFSVLFFSCSKNDTDNETPEFSQENTQRAAEVDEVFEGTLNIMETAYAEEEEGRTNSFFPPCAVFTISQQGENFELIIDFGEGCTLPNGAFVTGKVLLTYGPIQNNTRIIDYSFDEYSYNEHPVSGGGQIERLFENQNGNPQSTVNETITVGFPDSSITATRSGFRVAEWVEGVGSGTWLDNVFHITGNWDTLFSNGFNRIGEVVETLVKKANCAIVVSGNIEITQEGHFALLDYGDGTCDNIVTLIHNGIEYTIIIG